MSLNAEEKVVRQRLGVLELAEMLGNVSEAQRPLTPASTRLHLRIRRVNRPASITNLSTTIL